MRVINFSPLVIDSQYDAPENGLFLNQGKFTDSDLITVNTTEMATEIGSWTGPIMLNYEPADEGEPGTGDRYRLYFEDNEADSAALHAAAVDAYEANHANECGFYRTSVLSRKAYLANTVADRDKYLQMYLRDIIAAEAWLSNTRPVIRGFWNWADTANYTQDQWDAWYRVVSYEVATVRYIVRREPWVLVAHKQNGNIASELLDEELFGRIMQALNDMDVIVGFFSFASETEFQPWLGNRLAAFNDYEP